MTHPFEFPEAVYCTLGEALSAQPMAKFPFFFALKWCISTFPCLPGKFFPQSFLVTFKRIPSISINDYL